MSDSMPNGLLNIVVALQCEAIPIIEYFSLKKIIDTVREFPVYTNKSKTIYLIISGIGKIKSAIATTFLYHFTHRKKYMHFLNIGIAGSTQFKLGEIILVAKLNDTEMNWRAYPFVNHFKFDKLGELSTHSQVQQNYPFEQLVDMEGSGFFQAAHLFVRHEHIQLLKIISDTDPYSLEMIDKKSVQQLVQNQMDVIKFFIKKLLYFSYAEKTHEIFPKEFNQFCEKWHFTHTQKISLKIYLNRWSIQKKDQSAFEYCQFELNSKNIIRKLTEALNYEPSFIY